MLKKLKKRIEKRLKEEAIKYTQNNTDESIKIFNRPLEGEIVKISNIKIQENFKKPKSQKLKQRRRYYKTYNYFRSTIVLNKNNYLIDGYTTYLLAKEMGFDYITIVRAR